MHLATTRISVMPRGVSKGELRGLEHPLSRKYLMVKSGKKL